MLPLLSSKPKEVDLRTFVVPAFYRRVKYDVSNAHTCAIIPTYGPGKITLQLVKDLLRYDPRIHIYVVNDCTPQDFKESALIFGTLAGMGARVTLLRTPENKLKAGALNYALRYIQKHARRLPDVIVTLDDDVVIDRRTIARLKDELLKHPELGAVCSQCRVLNKDTNILTRLQGLEYLGFNAIRMADEGFIFGPLVMHGMLTAFRSRAIWDIGGFDEGHLIEDYEVTTRLKCSGWSVKSAPQALAWTVVPESLSRFWRQRTRWSYGGIVVVANAPRLWPVFQDILGHAVFCLTITTILILQFVHGSGHVPSVITQMILGLSFAQLSVGYLFQLWLMRGYAEKDLTDWVLRVALIPEFLYSYIMTAALLGSYLFYVFSRITRDVTQESASGIRRIWRAGSVLFRLLGYTHDTWGTRAS